jgi:hydrolase
MDHMCFVLEETGAMFTGDNILGHGNSVVVENLGRYMKSLDVMRENVHSAAIEVGYPGHGAVIEDLPSKVTVYTRHWETREKMVTSVFLGANTTKKSFLTTREITAHLYGPAMDAMAGPFIAQVLSKLAEEGKVGFTVLAQEKKWFLLRN